MESSQIIDIIYSSTFWILLCMPYNFVLIVLLNEKKKSNLLGIFYEYVLAVLCVYLMY